MGVLKRIWEVFDDRTGTSKLLGPVLSHPVPNATGWVGWSYALGSGVLLAFVLQVVTGIALAAAYIPSTADAFASLRFITEEATFGSLLRGMHNFGASAMIVLVGLHMAQTFLVGAYKYPREVSWLSGAVLLLLTMAMGFTGQLLRWDQIAYWSVFVLAQQAARTPFIGGALAELVLAGTTVNGATLSRFYAFHVFFIPALIFTVVALHLWLVLHHGVSEPPQPGRPVDPKTYRRWYHEMVEREGGALLAGCRLARRGARHGHAARRRRAGGRRRSTAIGGAARPGHPGGLPAPGLVFHLDLRRTGADAAGVRGSRHPGGAGPVRPADHSAAVHRQ